MIHFVGSERDSLHEAESLREVREFEHSGRLPFTKIHPWSLRSSAAISRFDNLFLFIGPLGQLLR
jgi:hypothetical protein